MFTVLYSEKFFCPVADLNKLGYLASANRLLGFKII